METNFLNVEQVSNILGVHPKTIRRYIKQGTLKANKICGQWKINRDVLKAFMGNDEYVENKISDNTKDLKGFIDGNHSKTKGKLQVCTIVDYYVDSVEEVKPLSQSLMDLMNSEDVDRKSAKFEFAYIETEKKARYTLWGNPKFLAKMLKKVDEISK